MSEFQRPPVPARRMCLTVLCCAISVGMRLVPKAWDLLNSLIFQCGNHEFTPSRWTKVLPCLQQWARGLTIHSVLRSSYIGTDVLVEDSVLSSLQSSVIFCFLLLQIEEYPCNFAAGPSQ